MLCTLARNTDSRCSYGDLTRRVEHRHVEPMLVPAFGRHLHGKLGNDEHSPASGQRVGSAREKASATKQVDGAGT